MTPDEYVQTVRDEIVRLSIQHTSADQLGMAITSILNAHREFPIYDECDHEHDQIDTHVADIEDIGLTCNKIKSACSLCCTEDGGGDYQDERCADAHTSDCWPCQPWLDAGDALSIPRPDTQHRRR
ncbi:hypothetical protein [Saccharopolyspora taberi]|uniref:Uncharacterized protein n=1 Tax=Saccharopolyspora taberi TaxID=60895 RepID=A0ABN3V0Z9_9PSEU